ncbi:hypothetical protein GW17_00048697 [Ensete ventricosum]|nr:hypothetical protein GW17_00048697 [Ensete ventricosum]
MASPQAVDPYGLVAGGHCPCGCRATSVRARRHLPPLRAGRSRLPPVQGALAVASRTFAGGLGQSRSPL